MQWRTEKAGDFLITAWLEECEVGGCAKACSVQVSHHLQSSHNICNTRVPVSSQCSTVSQ